MSDPDDCEPIQFSFKMNDAIHGHMQLEPLIFKIIDTPEFQRLRHIKQISTSVLVYPSATHTRFEHSIGVCHLANEMLNTLEKQTPNLIISDKHKLCVKIAALCHDLGHGPFSHSWETFVRRRQPQDNWKHEDASVLMFKKLITNVETQALNSDDILMIENLIKGSIENYVKPKDYFLYEIVNNKYCDMDVDKWDYLMRDSKYSNIPTGFDYKRLLSGVRVITDKKTHETHISYRDSDAINVSRMYMDRANLHFYCYQHIASLMAEEMYMDALSLVENQENMKIILKNGQKYTLSTAHNNMDAYEQLTDSVIQKSYWTNCDEAQALLKRILVRNFYKVVYRKKLNCMSDLKCIEKNKEQLLSYLSREFGMKFGIRIKTMAMGNDGKLKNTPFHNKCGEKLYIQDLQLFRQSGSPEKFWYGEIIIFCKESKTELQNCNYKEIDSKAEEYVVNKVLTE